MERIGAGICKSLPRFHAFTGCGTVSAFQGRGIVLVFRIMAQDQGFQEVFQRLGRGWQLSNKLYRDLPRFTCAMYCKNAGTNEVNKLRYRLFCLKKGGTDIHNISKYHFLRISWSKYISFLMLSTKQDCQIFLSNWRPRSRQFSGHFIKKNYRFSVDIIEFRKLQ